MKYNEAIDMILDGGEAYRKKERSFRYIFDLEGRMRQKHDYDSDFRLTWPLTKEDFTATDWIVEKDGVVYEEAPNGTPPIICMESRLHEKDLPAELEEGGEPWKEIKLECIADKVDEDWLEKKMLCFMKKVILGAESIEYENASLQDIIRVRQEYLADMDCGNDDCPFCFPEQPKNDHSEEPREMVTVEDLKNDLGSILDWVAPQEFFRGSLNEAKICYENERFRFMEKLKYLVSLQEK